MAVNVVRLIAVIVIGIAFYFATATLINEVAANILTLAYALFSLRLYDILEGLQARIMPTA